ncbi:MAG TPA: hypothetical protein VIW64_18835 [Pyrinomonadaceae bacterium]|jgi:hypothetical protein
MQKHTRTSINFAVMLCVMLLAICALAVFAQSGRHVRKGQAMPVPVPDVTPAPTPVEKPKPQFTFVVGLDKYGDFSRVSLYVFSGVLHSCVDRLNESPLVKATVASSDISRAEAVKMARAEKESYVIWIQLRSETQDLAGNSNNLYINYTVFAPVTAKTATQGNTYPNAYRRGINLPTTTTGGDYYLNQAARGAAERILDHFHLPLHR